MEPITLAISVAAVLVVGAGSRYIFIKRKKKPGAAAKPSEPAVPLPPLQPSQPKRSGLSFKLHELILKTKHFDESFLDSLEELLYTGDLGPRTVEKLLAALREKLSRGELRDVAVVKQNLFNDISEIMKRACEKIKAPWQDGSLTAVPSFPSPWVILMVGVNGVGKTTSVGKLAHFYSKRGKKVLVVAADTFRAAAEEQLAVWGARAQVSVYTSDQTKDPAAVCFQGIQKAITEHYDIVIVDTAGRLHTKENLMEELKKVKRVAAKALPTAPHEIVLVVDASSGQNARVQTQQFHEALGLTSLIVTKLDGTPRGGVLVGIADEFYLGPQFVGVGEKLDDLQRFSSHEFTQALLEMEIS